MPLAGAAEVDAAVARRAGRAARVAGDAAARSASDPAARLADLLERSIADEAAAINALDNGTPVSAMTPGSYTAVWTRYYAGWIDKLEGSGRARRTAATGSTTWCPSPTA